MSLPGQARVSEDLLDRAVADLRRIHTKRGLEMAREVGQYVLRVFFDNDGETFEQAARGHSTFRSLARDPRVGLSHSYIWYAARVEIQIRHMPREVAYELPLSHHRLLVSVHDQPLKLRLAKEAANRRLSKRAFKSLIDRHYTPGRKGRAGRKPLPGFVKELRGVVRGVEQATQAVPASLQGIEHLNVDDLKDLLSRLYATVGHLQDMTETINEMVLEVEHGVPQEGPREITPDPAAPPVAQATVAA
jgi:hypothetical protein